MSTRAGAIGEKEQKGRSWRAVPHVSTRKKGPPRSPWRAAASLHRSASRVLLGAAVTVRD
jgi:hypothetical protein